MAPPTVVAVKFALTHVAISAPSLVSAWPAAPTAAAPSVAADEVVDRRRSATYAWNCSRVGLGSLPLKPPIAITGRPVASW